MKLTVEQSDAVAENHNLIYWYINRNSLELSEYYDLLAIELCNTIVHYDSTKGSLANYFKLRADGIIYKEYRKTQAQKRMHIGVPLLDNLHTISGTSQLDLVELDEWMDCEDGEILRMKADGYSQTEIADKLGVSQSYVSKILKRLKKEYLER